MGEKIQLQNPQEVDVSHKALHKQLYDAVLILQERYFNLTKRVEDIVEKQERLRRNRAKQMLRVVKAVEKHADSIAGLEDKVAKKNIQVKPPKYVRKTECIHVVMKAQKNEDHRTIEVELPFDIHTTPFTGYTINEGWKNNVLSVKKDFRGNSIHIVALPKVLGESFNYKCEIVIWQDTLVGKVEE